MTLFLIDIDSTDRLSSRLLSGVDEVLISPFCDLTENDIGGNKSNINFIDINDISFLELYKQKRHEAIDEVISLCNHVKPQLTNSLKLHMPIIRWLLIYSMRAVRGPLSRYVFWNCIIERHNKNNKRVKILTSDKVLKWISEGLDLEMEYFKENRAFPGEEPYFVKKCNSFQKLANEIIGSIFISISRVISKENTNITDDAIVNKIKPDTVFLSRYHQISWNHYNTPKAYDHYFDEISDIDQNSFLSFFVPYVSVDRYRSKKKLKKSTKYKKIRVLTPYLKIRNIPQRITYWLELQKLSRMMLKKLTRQKKAKETPPKFWKTFFQAYIFDNLLETLDINFTISSFMKECGKGGVRNVFYHHEVSPWGYAIAHHAKLHSIRSIALQHGLLADGYLPYQSSTLMKNESIFPDTLACWGDSVVDFLEDNFPSKIESIGCPRFNKIRQPSFQSKKSNTTVLIAPSDWDRVKLLSLTISLAMAMPKLNFVIKPKPFKSGKTIKWLKSNKKTIPANVRILPSSRSIYDIFPHVDIVVNSTSVIVEALLQGKKTICPSFLFFQDLIPIKESSPPNLWVSKTFAQLVDQITEAAESIHSEVKSKEIARKHVQEFDLVRFNQLLQQEGGFSKKQRN